MNADYGRRPLLIVLVLFVISILLDRFLIAGLCPWVSSLGGVSLMVVFLDIPLALPMIDPLPVAVIFSLFYSMTAAGSSAGRPVAQGERLSRIWGGVIVLACWMAGGALAYHFTEGLLTREVRNGIDSFGVHADIHTPFTEYSILHLRGGFILLLCFIIGGRTLVKRVNRAAIAHPVPGMISSETEMAGTVARQNRPREVETVDASLRGFAEPARHLSPEMMEAPAAMEPLKPRVAAKSVAIVAPRRVEVVYREKTSTPLY